MGKLAKYWAIFRTQLQNGAAYPLDLAARSLSIVLFMLVFFSLWRAAYDGAGAAQIAGLTLHDTLWYLMLAETIVLSRPRIAQTIATQVKDGSIAYILNKPYSFLLYHVAVALGDAVTRIVSNLLVGGATVWLLVGPPPDWRGWPLALIALILGWLIDFCMTSLIGLAAFVAEDVSAFEWIYNKLLMILGGMFIPLDFFPGWLMQIAHALPFAAAVYGPARLFVSPEPAAFLSLAVVQIGWLLGLGGLAFLVYRRAEGWLSINGG